MTNEEMTWHPRHARRAIARADKSLRRIAGTLLGRGRKSRATRAGELSRGELDVALAAIHQDGHPQVAHRVLVDGSWENPNYWYRYALLRAALNVPRDGEVGFIGPYQRQTASRTLRAFGASTILDFELLRKRRPKAAAMAAALLRSVRSPTDIIDWDLPSGLPGAVVYDGILKRQRLGRVDLEDPLLIDYVAEAVSSILAAEDLLDAARPDIVVLSHAIEFRYGSIAWCALRRKIPVIVAFGNYGSPRYCFMRTEDEFFESLDRPSPEGLNAITADTAVRLEHLGRTYLDRRLAGQTDDLGGRFAFAGPSEQHDRTSICEEFGWDPSKPIVAVYSSNWFDYPHTFGMQQYKDFVDWLTLTLDVAKGQTACNWLFRAHPVDAWYGGVTLSDHMTSSPAKHIRLCPKSWNGAAVQRAVDGLVTVHGTAGVEYAAAGKPTLVADRGWYHEMSFVTWPRDREAYVKCLENLQWLKRGGAENARLAQMFAGAYFSLPGRSIALGDDSDQALLIPRLLQLVKENSDFVQSEVASISRWLSSGTIHFHSWRMLADRNFQSTE